MVVTARPDLAGAINARLRSSTAIAALTSTRISTSRQSSWGLPAYAILIETGRGGGEEDTPGLKWERVDLLCYGPDARTAHLLWRTVDYFFCPDVGSRASGFRATASGETVSVTKVAQEGGPLRLVEPDDAWPYTWASYRVTYASEPVS